MQQTEPGGALQNSSESHPGAGKPAASGPPRSVAAERPDVPPSMPLTLQTSLGPVPLGFVTRERQLYLIAQKLSARWPIEILRRGRASASLPGGASVDGRVALVTDPEERVRVLGYFREKYGREAFAQWYDHPARVLDVDLDIALSAGAGDPYDDWIESEFDNIAEEYDHHILANPVNRLLRDRSLEWLRTVFAPSRSLLEIGCGSGIETIALLEEGHEVTAVDVSMRMLDVVRRKAHDAGMAERLRPVHLRARDLSRLVKETGATSFDGAYSTYGALNCEPALRPVVVELGKLLPPGRKFVAGVYNRWCLFETAAYSATLQFGRAVGRWRNPVRVGTSRFCVDVFAFSPPEFRRLWAPEFTPVRVEGVPVIVPPSDLSPYVEKLSRRLERWARWDRALGRRWPLRYLGDHFLMTFVRRSGE